MTNPARRHDGYDNIDIGFEIGIGIDCTAFRNRPTNSPHAGGTMIGWFGDANDDPEPDSDETDSTRAYLEIKLADEPITVRSLEESLPQLHDTCDDVPLEWLLVGTGETVSYYVGADDEHIERVQRNVEDLFPNETTIARSDAPTELLADLGSDDTAADAEASTESAAAPDPAPPATATALEFYGHGSRRNDWVTRLTPVTGRSTTDGADGGRPPTADVDPTSAIQSPLRTVVDKLAAASADTTIVYQAMVAPFEGDWTGIGMDRKLALETRTDTLGMRLTNGLFDSERPDQEENTNLSAAARQRIDEIDAADTSTAFAVAARVYGEGPDAAELVEELESTFKPVQGDYYRAVAHPADTADETAAILDAIRSRAMATTESVWRRHLQRLPGTPNSRPVLITDPETAPAFCILDGSALNGPGRDALETTPGEKAGVSPPTDDRLDTYDTAGLTLGRVLDSNDDATDRTVALPPALQPLHVAWFGATGSGKSVALAGGQCDNVAATDGPDILLERKGDGMADDYLKAHYAQHGDLEDVYYFDCSEVVPAMSFFDIRDALAAGIPRESAVQAKANHYVELLRGIMGADAFQAKRAPDVIRYLVRALYDPKYGSDAFAHSDLVAAATRMKQHGEAPPVSNDQLEQLLETVTAGDADLLQGIMTGVDSRVETPIRDSRIGRLFEHTPPADTQRAAADGGTATETAADYPWFDIAEFLDEDAVVILDMGGLREDAQRALSMVVLSNLWTALKQRERRRSDRATVAVESESTDDPPLVNLYVEEAADVADTSLMADLLSKSRSFGLSVTLAMQYPAQLEASSPRVYSEVLNNVGTILAGKIGRDPALADRLATDDMPPADVANRLRGLRRGQWLATLPAGFDEPAPRPFLLQSAAPPAGHPASDEPLTGDRLTAFDAARYRCLERTRRTAGLIVGRHGSDRVGGDSVPSQYGTDATEAVAAADPADELRPRVDTTLPYTTRLPEHLSYDGDRHALVCTGCDAVYDPDSVGLERSLECCPDGDIDPDDVPICEVTLKRTREEREACAYSDGQLMFLQAVYNAAQLRYEPPHYDILHDSMLRLQEYVGIDTDADAVAELLDDGVLRHDGDHPHRLYTVTAAGRDLLGEKHRHGVAYGHGKGDLGEGSSHAMGVDGALRWVRQTYVADPDCEAEVAIPYYDLDDDDTEDGTHLDDTLEGDASGNAGRLDVAALDADGNIVVCVEVERVNNDVAEAVPADYDKMATCDPEAAIWIVLSHSAGHDVIDALYDSGRVDDRYTSTAPQNFRIDAAGLTDVYPVTWIRDRLDEV